MTTLAPPNLKAEDERLDYFRQLAARAYKPTTRAHLQVRQIGVYLRQSLDQFGDNLAIDRQREACDKLVAELSAVEVAAGRPALVIRDYYVDNSVSATSRRKKRPGWEKLWADTEAGLINGWVAVHPDRLYRHPSDLEKVINLAESLDLFLATVNTRDFDLRTPEGKMMARAIGIFSRYEMERKGSRQRDMHDQRARRGVPWVTTRPFGYVVVKDADNRVSTLAPHPEEAEALRWAYAQVLSGASLYSVTTGLAARGFRTTGGKKGEAGGPWTTTTLARTMANPLYAGVRVHTDRNPNTGEVKGVDHSTGNWQALVSDEDFKAVAKALRSHPRVGVQGGPRRLLSGLVLCGLCEDGGKIGSSQDRKGVMAYRCKRCNRVSRNAEALEEFVERRVVAILQDRAEQLQADQGGGEVDDLSARLLRVKADLDALQADYLGDEGLYTREEYQTERKVLVARRRDLEDRLAQIERRPALESLFNGEETWDSITDLERKRQIIRDVLPVVVILPAGQSGRPAAGAPKIDPTKILIGEAAVAAYRAGA